MPNALPITLAWGSAPHRPAVPETSVSAQPRPVGFAAHLAAAYGQPAATRGGGAPSPRALAPSEDLLREMLSMAS